MRSRTAPAALALVAALTGTTPAGADAQASTAAIEGTVALDLGPTRRTAQRYPSGGATISDMQAVPAVVYLEGAGLGSSAEPVTFDIGQEGTAFLPSALAVGVGSTVRFPNHDPFYHNVYSYAENIRFDLGRYPSGESREVTFGEPGIARVFCEIHEFMRAVIVVTPHGFGRVVGPDGTFAMDGVPPGAYTVVAYHPDAGFARGEVRLEAGQRARVELQLRR